MVAEIAAPPPAPARVYCIRVSERAVVLLEYGGGEATALADSSGDGAAGHAQHAAARGAPPPPRAQTPDLSRYSISTARDADDPFRWKIVVCACWPVLA